MKIFELQKKNVMQPQDLIEHPEGGRFREVFRSTGSVTTQEGKVRPPLTHIYFSLLPGEVSRFHQVASDEVWNLYQGEGVYLYIWDGSDVPPERITISRSSNQFCHVVEAGLWQAAEPINGEILAGCSVAPGFEFSDFKLMAPESIEGQQLRAVAPDMSRLL